MMKSSLAIRFAPVFQMPIVQKKTDKIIAFLTWSPQRDADDHSSYIEWMEGAVRFAVYHNPKQTKVDKLVLRGSFPTTVLEGPKRLRLVLERSTRGKWRGPLYVGVPGCLYLQGEVLCKASLRAQNQWGRYPITSAFDWERAYQVFLECDAMECLIRHQTLRYNEDPEEDCGFNIYTPVAVSGCHRAVDKRAILLTLARARRVDPTDWVGQFLGPVSATQAPLMDRVEPTPKRDLSDLDKLIINSTIARMFD